MPPKTVFPSFVKRPISVLVPVLACLLMTRTLIASCVPSSGGGDDGSDDIGDPPALSAMLKKL